MFEIILLIIFFTIIGLLLIVPFLKMASNEDKETRKCINVMNAKNISKNQNK